MPEARKELGQSARNLPNNLHIVNKNFCIAALASLAFLAGCSDEAPKEPPKPLQISDLSNKISTLAETPDALEIVIRQTSILSEETVLFVHGQEANKIAKGIQQSFPNIKAQKIRFTAEVPLQDKYGNSAPTRIFAFAVPLADIRKINFAGNFEHQDLLGLSSEVWYVEPISRNLVNAYCKSSSGQYAQAFCTRERMGFKRGK